MTIQSKKLLVGLTGGIACGKSTALGILGQLGWQTISTDAIVADLLQNDYSLKKALKTKWGPAVFDDDEINKKKISEIIFNDQEARTWLENLLHPLVREIWKKEVVNSEEKNVVVEIPLLFEKKLEHLFQITVCVQCEKKTQLKRLFDRGLTKAQSNARIDAQLPMGQKSQLADIVLLGENSLSFLKRQICIFHARVT